MFAILRITLSTEEINGFSQEIAILSCDFIGCCSVKYKLVAKMLIHVQSCTLHIERCGCALQSTSSHIPVPPPPEPGASRPKEKEGTHGFAPLRRIVFIFTLTLFRSSQRERPLASQGVNQFAPCNNNSNYHTSHHRSNFQCHWRCFSQHIHSCLGQ